jgi:hypothetical protein
MSVWKTTEPPFEEAIFAIVKTNGGDQVFICQVDENETLVDLEYGDDYGWQRDCVDCWCTLQEAMQAIEAYNPPHAGEEEPK